MIYVETGRYCENVKKIDSVVKSYINFKHTNTLIFIYRYDFDGGSETQRVLAS